MLPFCRFPVAKDMVTKYGDDWENNQINEASESYIECLHLQYAWCTWNIVFCKDLGSLSSSYEGGGFCLCPYM